MTAPLPSAFTVYRAESLSRRCGPARKGDGQLSILQQIGLARTIPQPWMRKQPKTGDDVNFTGNQEILNKEAGLQLKIPFDESLVRPSMRKS
jgi:hypothetical protein